MQGIDTDVLFCSSKMVPCWGLTPPLSSRANVHLTTVWFCIAWRNTRWFESESSIQMSVICSIPFGAADIPRHHGTWNSTILKGLSTIHQTYFRSVRCSALACAANLAATVREFFARNINCDVLIGWNSSKNINCDVLTGLAFKLLSVSRELGETYPLFSAYRPL